MARLVIISLAVGAMALPAVLAPSSADASCRSRKTTGLVVGGVGGALIGNSISKGGGGAVVGGLGGALLGRHIAKSGCRTRSAYYEAGPRIPAPEARAAQPARTVYYDARGNPVASGVVRNGTFQTVSNDAPGACRTETQSYYNERGRLTQQPVQVCAR